MTYTEKSVGDAGVTQSDEATPEDTAFETDAPDRSALSPLEWATGIRRLRRSVIIHDTGHLLADLDELGDRIETAPSDSNVDDLIDRYEALAEQIKGGVRYVAEQRSQDWIDATRKAVCESKGWDPNTLDDQQKQAVYYERVAAQIVEPKGVTAESLRALFDQVPSEAAVLFGMVERANTTVTAAVESRDFSSRRSGKKSTKASSGR